MKAKLAALAGCGMLALMASTQAAAQEVGAANVVSAAESPLVEENVTYTLTAFPGPAPTEYGLMSGAPLSSVTPISVAEPITMNRRATSDGDSTEPAGQGVRGESRWLSEVRLGLLAQDRGPIVNDVESGAAINVEMLFTSPRVLSAIGSPRPHIGISAATDPEATSYAYAGVTWERELQQDWFLVGGLGLAVHDGEILRKSEQPPELWGRVKTLGCRVDFHWGVGVGRRLSERWNIALHYEHVSSADVCIKGALGLENVGVRFGRVF